MLNKISTVLLILLLCGTALAQTCAIGGCNNEICSKAGENHFSTCMWKAEYECYNKFGICEANSVGECCWRQTPELVECIKLRQKQVADADAFSD